MNKKRLLVIDSNSLLHRAFHALPPLKTKKDELVNAVYGFLLVFFKAIREFQPSYIAACFDFPGPTFRHKKFREYKAKRIPAPKEFYDQIPRLKEILKIFSVPIFEKEGFEADDLIATISKKISETKIPQGRETIVLSGDQDTLQCVDPQTRVCLLKKGVKETMLYDKNTVKEKYGLLPGQIPDFKALRGDPSDNIPGVPGVGEKTALELLEDFKTIENLYQELEKNSDKTKKIKPKLKEMLIQKKEQVFLSRTLAKVKEDVPIEFDIKKCQWGKFDREKITQIFKDFQFQSLIKRLSEISGKEPKNLSLW